MPLIEVSQDSWAEHLAELSITQKLSNYFAPNKVEGSHDWLDSKTYDGRLLARVTYEEGAPRYFINIPEGGRLGDLPAEQ